MLTDPAAAVPEPGRDRPSLSDPVAIPVRAIGPWHSWRTGYVAALICADTLAAVVAIWTCYAVRSQATLSHVTVLDREVDYSTLALLTVPVWVLSLALAGAYRSPQADELRRLPDRRFPRTPG